MSGLIVEHLTLSFGGIKAINDVSFAVELGEIYAIIGPNGAGKSTIFNAISRIYHPDSGSIKFRGQELLERRANQVVDLGIARTFQNIELFEKATVLENLLVGRSSKIKTGWISEWFFTKRVRDEERNHRRKALSD